jgi:hypothetical protein
LISTVLDAVGVLAFGRNAVKSVQPASGVVTGSISAYNHSMTGAGPSAGGLVLAAAENSGAKVVLNGVEMVPIAGNVVSAIATVERPAFLTPVLMRETGQKGAEGGEGQEAYT